MTDDDTQRSLADRKDTRGKIDGLLINYYDANRHNDDCAHDLMYDVVAPLVEQLRQARDEVFALKDHLADSRADLDDVRQAIAQERDEHNATTRRAEALEAELDTARSLAEEEAKRNLHVMADTQLALWLLAESEWRREQEIQAGDEACDKYADAVREKIRELGASEEAVRIWAARCGELRTENAALRESRFRWAEEAAEMTATVDRVVKMGTTELHNHERYMDELRSAAHAVLAECMAHTDPKIGWSGWPPEYGKLAEVSHYRTPKPAGMSLEDLFAGVRGVATSPTLTDEQKAAVVEALASGNYLACDGEYPANLPDCEPCEGTGKCFDWHDLPDCPNCGGMGKVEAVDGIPLVQPTAGVTCTGCGTSWEPGPMVCPECDLPASGHDHTTDEPAREEPLAGDPCPRCGYWRGHQTWCAAETVAGRPPGQEYPDVSGGGVPYPPAAPPEHPLGASGHDHTTEGEG